jgi:crotonobetainyl-CoA:carnitine CoA-transferase CaiB-like acyl-CoA transferase
VRVADWTQFGVGPFATALLGALGADVIKIENPPRGDPQAYIPPTVNGIAGLYINYNTNKRSMFLNLRDDADMQVMWDLLASADLFVNNLRPGSVQRAGLHEDVVLERYPGLVYVLSNGYGEEGPRAEEGGGDNWLQVYSGWCSVTGAEAGEWEFLRFLGHIDLNTSLYIAAAALTGLATRNRFGGHSIRISMLDAAISMQATRIAEYLNGGVTPGPLGSAASVVAPSQAFECEDDEYVAVVAESEGQWRRLCDAIDRPDLAARPEYETNAARVERRNDLAAELGAVFGTKPAPWWNQQLTKAKVPNSRFWNWELMKVHPQVVENEHIVLIDTGRYGPVYTGGPPWKFEEAPCRVAANPSVGEQTDEIRGELSELRQQPEASTSPSTDAGMLPFDGLRVIELATGISGPYCGSLLADQGAKVVKIEPPEGDRVRFWGAPFIDGVSPAFIELNRNKDILVGEHDVAALIRDADVVIVDAVDPDGNPPLIDLRALRSDKPELVVCSISAYGERGPLADQPGAELCVQAMCNTWAGLGRIGEAPRRLGADQATMNAGVTAYQGIVAALIRRDHTGRGDRIEASALGAHHSVKGMHWVCLSNPDQWPGLHLSLWTEPPNYGVRTSDRPVLVMPTAGLPRPDGLSGQDRVEALIRGLGGEVPAELDMAAPFGTRSHFMHFHWAEFWSGLFGEMPWQDVARAVEQQGGRVTPFLDYPSFDTDPHMQVVKPFAALTGSEDGRRVVRMAWKQRAGKGTLSYREPVTVTEVDWQSASDASAPLGAD